MTVMSLSGIITSDAWFFLFAGKRSKHKKLQGGDYNKESKTTEQRRNLCVRKRRPYWSADVQDLSLSIRVHRRPPTQSEKEITMNCLIDRTKEKDHSESTFDDATVNACTVPPLGISEGGRLNNWQNW
jgi:hypothetical protein